MMQCHINDINGIHTGCALFPAEGDDENAAIGQLLDTTTSCEQCYETFVNSDKNVMCWYVY